MSLKNAENSQHDLLTFNCYLFVFITVFNKRLKRTVKEKPQKSTKKGSCRTKTENPQQKTENSQQNPEKSQQLWITFLEKIVIFIFKINEIKKEENLNILPLTYINIY